VIPTGRALLYAEPIYLQAERSPMPELRLVVLALQDRLAYGPTFESALTALFGGAASSLSAASAPPESARHAPASAPSTQPAADLNALIAEAAKDVAEYQRLTAEGKLGEAGQKLEELKRVIDRLNTRQRYLARVLRSWFIRCRNEPNRPVTRIFLTSCEHEESRFKKRIENI